MVKQNNPAAAAARVGGAENACCARAHNHYIVVRSGNLHSTGKSSFRSKTIYGRTIYGRRAGLRLKTRLRAGRGKVAGPDLGRRALGCSAGAAFLRAARFSWVT